MGNVSLCSVRKVGVATMNPGKIRAISKAFKRFCNIEEIVVVSVPGKLPPQPAGSLDITRGAFLRAINGYRKTGEAGVGVEAGPMEFYAPGGFIETQVSAIIINGKVSVGLSSSFPLPRKLLSKMVYGVELGSLVEEKRSISDIGESIGYIGLATEGAVTREDLTFQSVVMALVPWIKGYDYDLPSIKEFSDQIGLEELGL
ncbi:MAG: DUF84 family protein [Desulfurococcales archaeon]|nr:DUF84 family protein [Desulfurococcales archaeon]